MLQESTQVAWQKKLTGSPDTLSTILQRFSVFFFATQAQVNLGVSFKTNVGSSLHTPTEGGEDGTEDGKSLGALEIVGFELGTEEGWSLATITTVKEIPD